MEENVCNIKILTTITSVLDFINFCMDFPTLIRRMNKWTTLWSMEIILALKNICKILEHFSFH